MSAGSWAGRPGEAPADAAHWTRAFVLLSLGVLVLRAVYSAVFPLDLAPDESYYWDWGRRLDYGYFSKPPMIAWLMALAGWIGSDTMFVLKLFPALMVTGGLAFVFLLGRDLWGARAGFWAVLVLLATPANAALSLFFTIDAPLFLFWSASLWFAWRWWRAGTEGKGGWWATALAVSLGLGYLTKQIQLVFPVLLLVYAALMRGSAAGGRRSYGSLVLALLASLLFLTPPLVWNWQHDWITFRHTADELDRSPLRWGRSLKFVAEFVGGQAGLGGGLTWLLMLGVAAAGMRRWREADAAVRFLLLFFVPGLAAFAALAIFQRVEQNWPLVFYVSAAVLLAGWGAGRTRSKEGVSGLLKLGVGLGGILALGLMAVPFVLPASRLAGAKSDATARIRGWRELAGEVERVRRDLPQPGQTLLIAPLDRYAASALAYYLPDRPRTYCWEDPRRPQSQYGIWGRPTGKEGWDALVIEKNSSSPRLRELAGAFTSWEPVGEIVIRLGPQGTRDRRFFLFLGRGYRGG